MSGKITKQDITMQIVGQLAHYHKDTWKNESDHKWLDGLFSEFDQLGMSIEGIHEHDLNHELAQIASIAINWMVRNGYDAKDLRQSLVKSGHLI